MTIKAANQLIWQLIAAIVFLVLTGCQSAMSSQTDSKGYKILPNEFPLRFKKHAFGARCYSTLDCSVTYSDDNHTRLATNVKSDPPISPDYLKNWNGSYLGVHNFPPPAIVRWTTLDGSMHEASVDIAAIFQDELVLHKVPENEIPEGWAHSLSPAILLEVNNRTINVYMRAHIATRKQQIPGNVNSNHRTDLILAWSKTY